MIAALLHTLDEGPDSDVAEACEHDRIEQVHTHGRGPYATRVWACPDCGHRKTEAYEP